jgi:hypothetical protein
MPMRSIAIFLLTVASAVPLFAHHNAYAPDRTRQVTIEGTVEAFTFAAPHVEIRIRAAEGVLYTAEWQTTAFLTGTGITRDTIKVGDRLIVRGSPHKDSAVRKVTLLAEIRRPADGWGWNSPQYK